MKGTVARKLCYGAAQAALAGYTDASFQAMNMLHYLLGLGSWPAAVEAAQTDKRLQLTTAPSAAAVRRYISSLRELEAAGLSTQQLQTAVALIAQIEDTDAARIEGLLPLQLMLGSWDAALAAASSDMRLLRLPTGAEAEETAGQLRAAGVPSEQLLQLLRAELEHRLSSPNVFTSLQLLNELLGGWRAAVDAACGDRWLLRLPVASSATLEVADQLRASGLSRQQLVALLNVVYPRLQQSDSASDGSDAGDSEDSEEEFEWEDSDEEWEDSDEEWEDSDEEDSDFDSLDELHIDQSDPLGCLRQLCVLLGSWRAAGEALLADRSLLKLQAPLSRQHGVCAQLAASGLSEIQLFGLAQLLACNHMSIERCLQALDTARLLLGGGWKAAVEATLGEPQSEITFFNLPPPCPAVEEVARQLDAVGYSPLQRLQLARAAARIPRSYVGSLQLLQLLFGTWRAALDAALQDHTLLHLPQRNDAEVCVGAFPL